MELCGGATVSCCTRVGVLACVVVLRGRVECLGLRLLIGGARVRRLGGLLSRGGAVGGSRFGLAACGVLGESSCAE